MKKKKRMLKNLMTDLTHKVIILGSGSAGYTAALYASRANLQPLLISGNQVGGQLVITNDVENYPGFVDKITGFELTEKMKEHAIKFGTKIVNDHIKRIEISKIGDDINYFKLFGANNDVYESLSLIVSTGATAKWLGLESEQNFVGHGVSACATCDGFFYKKKVVAVVGGGNTAAEEALFLTNYASKVYLVHRRDKLRAEHILQDRLAKNSKIEYIWNHVVEEVIGEETPRKKVTGLRLKSTINDSIKEIEINGLFIAIGHKPNSEIFKEILDIDNEGYIKTNGKSTLTNVDGIFAAGDVQDKIYRQAVTAAGTGCMAALDAEKYLAKIDDGLYQANP